MIHTPMLEKIRLDYGQLFKKVFGSKGYSRKTTFDVIDNDSVFQSKTDLH